MPVPETPEQLLELTYKSGVVDTKRIDAFVQANPSLPTETNKLAAAMIKHGLVTRFQAEQLLQGKWRRFTIGNFKVLERLGSGGMGNVFLCEHQVMRHRVAIKVLATVIAEDPASLKRFYREARAAAALDHPNIVRAHDVGRDNELHFLVMDYVDGTCLQDIVNKFGPMDILRATHYIRQAAQGLQHAHEAGLIHRDIKPANLILDRNGVVKVLDMGVALFSQDDEEVLTKGPLGTADYLAPEQARDSHNVDFRVDIYSLGATYYNLLTAQVPFGDAKSVSQKLIYLQTREPRPIRELRPEVPEQLAAIIDKMMAKDPKKRYQTLAQVIQDLAPWTQKPIGPPPEKEMPRLSPAAMAPDSETKSAAAIQLPPVPAPAAPAPAAPARGGALLWVAVAAAVLVAAGIWYWFTHVRAG